MTLNQGEVSKNAPSYFTFIFMQHFYNQPKPIYLQTTAKGILVGGEREKMLFSSPVGTLTATAVLFRPNREALYFYHIHSL